MLSLCYILKIDQIPSPKRYKPVELNIATPGELVKMHLIALKIAQAIGVHSFLPVLVKSMSPQVTYRSEKMFHTKI